MAFKEMCLLSTLMMIAIVNYNVIESEALTAPHLTNLYLNVQKSLFELQQSELNLMNDSQKLYDLMNQHLAGRIDKSAVDAAQAELLRTRADWYNKAMHYLRDTTNFEPASNYPYASVDPLDLNPNIAYPNGVYPNGVYPNTVVPITSTYDPTPDSDTTIIVTKK